MLTGYLMLSGSSFQTLVNSGNSSAGWRRSRAALRPILDEHGITRFLCADVSDQKTFATVVICSSRLFRDIYSYTILTEEKKTGARIGNTLTWSKWVQITILARVWRPEEMIRGKFLQSCFAISLKLTIGMTAFASVATRVIISS